MNHLAHALLAGDDEELRLGGMLGDFVHGQPDAAVFPARVIAGIRLHRAIDVYTDAHPEVLAAKAHLPSPYRRYAGILLDMWFDHCLARDFLALAVPPLGDYLRRLARPAASARCVCCRRRCGGFAQLHGRAWAAGGLCRSAMLGRALAGIGQRLRRANPLDSALPVLLQRERALQQHFEAFFPQLQAVRAGVD